jgi:hypothetical protein
MREVDKEQMLDAVTRRLVLDLKFFDPTRQDNLEETQFSSLKAFAELALFCSLCCRKRGGRVDVRHAELAEFVINFARLPEFVERARDTGRFLLFALVHVLAGQLGFEDPQARRFLQGLLDQGYASAVERNAFRMMDLRYILDKGGFKHDLPPMRTIYQTTTLARRMPLAYIYNADAYALTHAIFYLCDFGFHAPSSIRSRDLGRSRWLVSNLLGMSVIFQNWDLVAELLLSYHFLQADPNAVYSDAWIALAGSQRPDGSFEGPAWSREHSVSLAAEPRRAYDFETNYHTTIVGGLSCLLT